MTTTKIIPRTIDEVRSEFRASGALLEGHFKLSSGRHSGHYLQCARVLLNPDRAGRLAQGVVDAMPADLIAQVDVVVSPAMGGIIIGQEIARVLGKDAMFLERPEGVFHLRRGFALEPGAKVLMVEDVVTTGLSSREAVLRQDVTRMQSIIDSRGSFMECAIREIDHLDIQSTDPDHKRIAERCKLQIPSPPTR